MGKYIIDVKDGETLYKAVIAPDGEPYITPAMGNVYTEPDTDEAYQRGYETAKHECEQCRKVRADAEQELAEKAYQRGLNDAWEAARKISHMSMAERNEVFGNFKMVGVIDNFSASEVIEKIRQYEQEKEEIQVGDEVVGTYTGGEETEPFVIIRKIPEIDPTYYFGIYSKSGEFCQGGLKLKKTGRHFPEIAEVLQKMKGGQQWIKSLV